MAALPNGCDDEENFKSSRLFQLFKISDTILVDNSMQFASVAVYHLCS